MLYRVFNINFVKSKLKTICTVWKFLDSCITEILREINFEDSRSAKSTVFAILGAVHLVNFIFQKWQKFIKIKIQRCVKKADFAPQESS